MPFRCSAGRLLSCAAAPPCPAPPPAFGGHQRRAAASISWAVSAVRAPSQLPAAAAASPEAWGAAALPLPRPLVVRAVSSSPAAQQREKREKPAAGGAAEPSGELSAARGTFDSITDRIPEKPVSAPEAAGYSCTGG